MLRKIVTFALTAGFIGVLYPHAYAADGATGKMHAEAVPLEKGSAAADASADDKGAATESPAQSDKPPRMAPASAKAAGSGTHVVIDGDTLWDLSGRYLDDPFMWTEVWKVNPHIANPHLIYPGDEVVIPGAGTGAGMAAKDVKVPGEKAGTAEVPGTVGSKGRYEKSFAKEEPFVDMGKTILRVDEDKSKIISLDETKKVKIPVTTLEEVLNAGYLSTGYEDYPWTNPQETKRLYYTLGDKILVVPANDISIGDYLVTVKEEGEVDHPCETFSDLGEMIQPTGMVQIKSEGGDFYVAEVVLALAEIETDDQLLKFETPETIYEPVPKNPKLKGKWGYVVASKWKKEMSEQSHYIYLDIGSEEGVKVGDVFEIRKEEPSESILIKASDIKKGRAKEEQLPPDAYKQGIMLIDYERPETYIGDAQVIYVQDGTCTARVKNSSYPIKAGYRAYYKD